MTDEEFQQLVVEALDSLPPYFSEKIRNVEVIVQEWPTPEQRQHLHLRRGDELFGLYEGIPLTQRGAGYNLVMPDRITIFQGPVQRWYHDPDTIRKEVRHTVIHEIAHFFGISDDRLRELGAY